MSLQHDRLVYRSNPDPDKVMHIPLPRWMRPLVQVRPAKPILSAPFLFRLGRWLQPTDRAGGLPRAKPAAIERITQIH
jgi:hypothetical protein